MPCLFRGQRADLRSCPAPLARRRTRPIRAPDLRREPRRRRQPRQMHRDLWAVCPSLAVHRWFLKPSRLFRSPTGTLCHLRRRPPPNRPQCRRNQLRRHRQSQRCVGLIHRQSRRRLPHPQRRQRQSRLRHRRQGQRPRLRIRHPRRRRVLLRHPDRRHRRNVRPTIRSVERYGCLSMISAQTRFAFVARETGFHFPAFSSEVCSGSREENA
jgi:hypothetical protein